MHDANAIAGKLIQLAWDTAGDRLTMLQVIKLVYFCHGWMLGIYGKPLILQHVEAWRYGPVVVDVYYALRKYGRNPIPHDVKLPSCELNKDELAIVERVYDLYGHWDGIELSRITHAPGTPWDIIWSTHGRNAAISNKLMKTYFQSLIRSKNER